jgi:adenosylmethionine-8-amino-7-oxononanoate aminotransferase
MNAVPSEAALRAWWMPFTHNRHFKAHPRLITAAQGAYYTLADGRRVFDGLSGLWCSPLGHSPARVVEAVQKQVATLDFAPSFQMGHTAAFTLAEGIACAARPRAPASSAASAATTASAWAASRSAASSPTARCSRRS